MILTDAIFGKKKIIAGPVFPTSGLIAYYKLDEVSGTVAVDSWNGENLGIHGALQIGQPGKIGTSFLNTGTWQQVHGGGCTPITGAFTINTWVKRTNIGGGANNVIVQQGDYGSGFGIWMSQQGGLLFRINSSYGAIGGNVALNSWDMITYRYTGSSLTYNYNTALVGAKAHTVNPISATTRRFFLRSGGGEMFRGYQDETGFWNRAITDEEMLLLFNEGNGLTL